MSLMFRPLVRYFDFQGRSRRSEYWLWYLFVIIINIALGIAQKAVSDTSVANIIMLSKNLLSLALLIPNLAVSVRRLHDTKRTGWWVLFPLAVAIVAMIVFVSVKGVASLGDMQNLQHLAQNASTPEGSMAFLTALGPLLLWVGVPYLLAALLVFVFKILDGTVGDNRYGSDPKGRGLSVNFF